MRAALTASCWGSARGGTRGCAEQPAPGLVLDTAPSVAPVSVLSPPSSRAGYCVILMARGTGLLSLWCCPRGRGVFGASSAVQVAVTLCPAGLAACLGATIPWEPRAQPSSCDCVVASAPLPWCRGTQWLPCNAPGAQCHWHRVHGTLLWAYVVVLPQCCLCATCGALALSARSGDLEALGLEQRDGASAAGLRRVLRALLLLQTAACS